MLQWRSQKAQTYESEPMQYFPLTLPFYLALAAVVVFLIALIELKILSYTFQKMGVHPRWIFALLIGSLLGSAVNIPVARIPEKQILSNRVVSFYGMRYVVPVAEQWPATIIAVNVGGALLPTLLSLYLLVKHRLWISAVLGVVAMALIAHALARPVHGVGIAMPVFVPPLAAAVLAMLLSWRRAAPLAYISGSLGTLIGADLMNLDRIQGLGAPVASIGGAGTFDGIFMTGILAVLLTITPPSRPPDDGAHEASSVP